MMSNDDDEFDDLPDPPPNPDDGTKSARGRKTECTPKMIEAFVTLLLQGNYRSTVCSMVGIGLTTFRRWMIQGQEHPDGIYGQFRRAVEQAEAASEASWVQKILAHSKNDPSLLKFLLERKFPHHWGQYRGETGPLKRRIRELETQLNQLLGLEHEAAHQVAS